MTSRKLLIIKIVQVLKTSIIEHEVYKKAIFLIYFIFVSIAFSGCAYKFGFPKRYLTGGYRQIAIPVFKNTTQEVGVEVYFSNELIRNFERSRVAKVVSKSLSPVILEGVIKSIKLAPLVQVKGGSSDFEAMPLNSVLTTKYSIIIFTELKLLRSSDNKVIWSSNFKHEEVYSAPQLESSVINSANVLYNHSRKQQSYKSLAKVMMLEVHDRLTEKF